MKCMEAQNLELIDTVKFMKFSFFFFSFGFFLRTSINEKEGYMIALNDLALTSIVLPSTMCVLYTTSLVIMENNWKSLMFAVLPLV